MTDSSTLRPLDDAVELADDLVRRGVAELFVPTRPNGGVEAWESERGELVVFGYTGVGALVASCGLGQPRERLTAADLVQLAGASTAPVVFAVNVWHPSGARYPEPDVRDMAPLEPAERLEQITEVWIPSLPMAPGARTAMVEMYADVPGEPMLLAYGSVEDLHRCCGTHQAAVSVRVDVLDQVVEQAGAHGVLFDAVLDEKLRYQAPVVDWTRHDLFTDDATPDPTITPSE